MANLNKTMIIGNLCRNPELRYTPSGVAVCTLGVAVNRNFKGKDGEKKQETCFINVVAWQYLAENANKYLVKGSSVFIEGRLQSRTWENQEGKKQTVIEIVAENIQFLTPVREANVAQEPTEPEVVITDDPEENMNFEDL